MSPSNQHTLFDTARAAHATVAPTKAQTCEAIMAFAIQCGELGFIADELAAAWNCSHNHVAPRISELLRVGCLRPTGRTRRTRAGCLARVLVAAQFVARSQSDDPAAECSVQERARQRNGGRRDGR